jgi:hypothetical protein
MSADDSTIHISGKNISEIQTKVQEDLNRIENKKVALIQGLNISKFLKEGRLLMIF